MLILEVMSPEFVVNRNNKSFVVLILVFNDACVVLVDRYCHRNIQLSQSCHSEEVKFLFTAPTRDQPIMLIFSPIMLCSGAQNFHLLCSILCSCERLVLKI